MRAAEGIVFVLSGPSGVGKGAIIQRSFPLLDGICRSVSATTRPPRPGEREGEDYFFVTEDRFVEMSRRGELLEWARVYGYHYGTPRRWVEERLAEGKDVVLEIDVQGGLRVRQVFPQAVLIFVAPPSWDELRRRLQGRQTESEDSLSRRLEEARREISQLGSYDYLIVNDRLEEAAQRFRAIIVAEKSRVARVSLDFLEKHEVKT